MEKGSSCFPNFACFRRKATSAKLKSSIRMPTIREFLSKNITTGTQIFEPKRNLSNDSKLLKSSSTHKSSLVIKRTKEINPTQLNDSLKTINLSMVSKGQFGNSLRGTFFLSKASFEDMFEGKTSPATRTSRNEEFKSNCPFVISNSGLKIVPITPKKRRSSYGSRINLALKNNLSGSAKQPPRTRRIFSYDWKKDLEDIKFK